MPQENTTDRFFTAVDDAYDIVLDSLKAGVDRGYRVSKGLIEQAQQGQHEAVELAATVAKSPTNLAQAGGAVVQNLTKTQARVLQLSRQWLDEALDSQQEGRDTLRRLIEANRQAGEAVIESSRGLFGQARDRARQAIRLGRDGRAAKPARETRPRRKAQAQSQTEETPASE